MNTAAETELKDCRNCGQSKPNTMEFFEKNKSCRKGLTSRCKICSNARAKKWCKDNRAQIIERWKARYSVKHRKARKLRDRYYKDNAPIMHRAHALSSKTRVRCAKLDIPIDLDIINPANLREMLSASTTCPCCGLQFEYRSRYDVVGGHWNTGTTPSLDKIIPALGYVRGNVAIICWRCNALKRDASLEELEKLVAWMRKVVKQ